MYLLLAALGLLLTLGLLSLTHFGVRRLLGRALGARDSRLFGVYWDGTPRQALLLRAAPLAAVCALIWGAAVVGALISGKQEPSTRVRVMPGAAARAGMQDGDRLLAIDGRVVDDWQAVLSASRSRAAERRYTVERAGERFELRTVPDEQGRVGIRPIYERYALGLGEAAREGLRLLWLWPRTAIETLTSPAREISLMGPVGIVREVREGGETELRFLRLLLTCASAVWPGFLLLEAIDALSLFGFTRFRPGLRSAPADEQESFRLGRLRQVLLALTALVLVLTLLGAVAEVAAPGPLPVSPLSQYWLGPSLLAVVFLMGSELGGRRLGAASAAALMVPCLGVALLVYLILSSRRELAKRGLACRWFRVEPLRGG